MKKEVKTCEFPDEYPSRLRKISWCIEGSEGAVCGPHKYYNRHLDYSTRGDSCFVKSVLLDWFYKYGCGQEVCDKVCQYFCECFTVYYKEGEEGFFISSKKGKDKKKLFDAEKFRRLWAENADRRDTDRMLVKMLKAVKEFYDSILKAHIENVLRKRA